MSILREQFKEQGLDAQSAIEAIRTVVEKVRTENDVKFGIDEVGVFKRAILAERYSVYGDKVFRQLGRSVVHLTPPHVSATELTESNLVKVECDFGVDSFAKTWIWESTSRAAGFTVTSPTEHVGKTYTLHRIPNGAKSTYVLAQSSMSAADAADVERVDFDRATILVKACHFTNQLSSFTEGSPSLDDGDPGKPKWSANTANNSSVEELSAAGVVGKEVRAWIMQRATGFV